MSKCELCGEPMPVGEEVFKYHGYSGPCPKPPLTVQSELPAPPGSANWWNEVKDSPAWSGAIVGLTWDHLWPEAKNDLQRIYDLSRQDFPTRLLGQQEIALTIQQIKELAEFAGLTISTKVSSLDDMEDEITILECEAGYEVIEDDGSRVRHKHVTYYTDYPEEGVMPLGRPNDPSSLTGLTETHESKTHIQIEASAN